ncbi:hypothetical protein ACJJTC_005903 [Scirpophaga incertulas]
MDHTREDSDSQTESCWKKDIDWKSRYAKLYGKRVTMLPEGKEEDQWQRISFMSDDNAPYNAMLTNVRANRRDSSTSASPRFLTSILARQSDLYGTYTGTGSMLSGRMLLQPSAGPSCSSLSSTVSDRISHDLGGHDTLLLDMVRARSQELEKDAQEQTLVLPKEESISEDQSSEFCIHGLSMRMTDRSISRSRMSRTSTRRDMDIPSILAFTADTTKDTQQIQPRIPAFVEVTKNHLEDTPRWSIRRAICPVCSQRWKDKSSIKNIKYSGLRRNSSSDLPSIIAPARLRTAITLGYSPRPIFASINQGTDSTRPLRVTSATWQLIRARRFRAPKPRLSSTDANSRSASAAPPAIRDLDKRVLQFLTDVGTKYT